MRAGSSVHYERVLIKKMYNGVYSPQARRIGKIIRDGALGLKANIGQNCILSKRDIDRLIQKCDLNKSKHALDMCCGDGGVDLYLAKKSKCKITGLDFSSAGIQAAKIFAREKNISKRCKFKLGLAEKVPFSDEAFDVIFSLDSFIHIPNKEKPLNECFRLLKPGGRLIFSDWVEIKKVSAKIQKSGSLWGYVYLSSPAAYKRLISKSGFKNVKMTDNNPHFKKLIARWERENWNQRDFLIRECGPDYFDAAKRRWSLAAKLSRGGFLGQSFFVCQKP